MDAEPELLLNGPKASSTTIALAHGAVGKPDRLRVEHLRTIKTPTLIVQGERDAFGNCEDVAGYRLSSAVRIEWIEDGDHSLKPRKASGRPEVQNWDAAIKRIIEFLTTL